MKTEDLLLIGAGGHALACLDVIRLEGKFRVVGMIGQPGEVGKMRDECPVIGDDYALPELLRTVRHVLVAVGQIDSPTSRMRLFETLQRHGALAPVIVSPLAYVSARAKIGVGTIVMHHAIVNANATVGRNCIINTRALVEHGVIIGDHCHLATASVVNGDAAVGMGSFIGSGAILRNGVNVGENCFVRMGDLIKHSLSDGNRSGASNSPEVRRRIL